MSARRSQTGFTLVELLIASMLGLFVTGIAMTSFVGHVRSAELGQALVALQTQARFALGEITAGVRSAGYIGCAGSTGAVPALPERLGVAATPRSTWRPLDGFTVGSSVWTPAYPEGYGGSGYTPPTGGPATPVPGSDAILVEGGVSNGSPTSSGVAADLSVELLEPAVGLTRGALALIGDCTSVEVFQVKRLDERADGTGSVVPDQPFLEAHDLNATFPLATRVMPYRRALYFIGDTGRSSENGEPVRALYEHLHPFADTVPAELADGVEAMVVRYRQRSASGTMQELAADAAGFDPALVVGVTVGLLISHAGHRPPIDERPVFNVAGIVVSSTAGAGPDHPDDSRMRRVFERSAVVRSRVESGMTP